MSVGLDQSLASQEIAALSVSHSDSNVLTSDRLDEISSSIRKANKVFGNRTTIAYYKWIETVGPLLDEAHGLYSLSNGGGGMYLAWVKEHCELNPRTAQRQRVAWRVISLAKANNLKLPSGESVCRSLTKLEGKDLLDAWRKASESATGEFVSSVSAVEPPSKKSNVLTSPDKVSAALVKKAKSQLPTIVGLAKAEGVSVSEFIAALAEAVK